MAASIRIPAHFCGVFGLKPTEQRLPLTGLIPGLSTPRSVRIMSCIGPMARTVEDLALLYQIIAGPDVRDTEVQPVPVDDVPQLELKHLRIAYAPTFPGFPVAAEIRTAVEELAQQLSPLCAVVEEATLPALDFNQELARAGEVIGMIIGGIPTATGLLKTPQGQKCTTCDPKKRWIACCDKHNKQELLLLNPLWRRIGEDTQAIFKILTVICGKLPGILTSGSSKNTKKEASSLHKDGSRGAAFLDQELVNGLHECLYLDGFF